MRKDRERNRLKNAPKKRQAVLPKRFKRPSDPEQAREWLNDVADHLSSLPNSGPSSRFVAFAIKRTLRKRRPEDLSKELGLIYPPGRPRTFKDRRLDTDIARKIDALIRNGSRWPQIEEKLNMDRRTLERIYERHEARFRKEERLAQVGRAAREVLRERQ
jgi:hypothetical protein